jgi:hypothetical protein
MTKLYCMARLQNLVGLYVTIFIRLKPHKEFPRLSLVQMGIYVTRFKLNKLRSFAFFITLV